MQSSKKSNKASARNLSVVLPVSIGSSTRAKSTKSKRKGAQTSSVPAALGPHPSVGRPNFVRVGGSDGRVRVRHREFVRDVSGSVDYSVLAHPINPGQSSTFPWLSGIAMGYESYVFHSLRFEYMPSVGTTVNGVVVLAVDYDALDPGPADKASLMQTHGAVRGSPWDYTVLQCDRPDLTKLPERYTRKAVWAGNGDLKTYDVGNLFVATHGQAGTTTIGELYVTYDVELRTPQPIITTPSEYSAQISSGGNLTLAKPLGTEPHLGVNPVVAYNAATGALNMLKVGKYLLQTFTTVGNTDGGNIAFTPVVDAAHLANADVESAAKGFQGYNMVQDFTLDVKALPVSIIPAIAGAAQAVGAATVRLAPFAF